MYKMRLSYDDSVHSTVSKSQIYDMNTDIVTLRCYYVYGHKPIPETEHGEMCSDRLWFLTSTIRSMRQTVHGLHSLPMAVCRIWQCATWIRVVMQVAGGLLRLNHTSMAKSTTIKNFCATLFHLAVNERVHSWIHHFQTLSSNGHVQREKPKP